jgi:hypothetical protein
MNNKEFTKDLLKHPIIKKIFESNLWESSDIHKVIVEEILEAEATKPTEPAGPTSPDTDTSGVVNDRKEKIKKMRDDIISSFKEMDLDVEDFDSLEQPSFFRWMYFILNSNGDEDIANLKINTSDKRAILKVINAKSLSSEIAQINSAMSGELAKIISNSFPDFKFTIEDSENDPSIAKLRAIEHEKDPKGWLKSLISLATKYKRSLTDDQKKYFIIISRLLLKKYPLKEAPNTIGVEDIISGLSIKDFVEDINDLAYIENTLEAIIKNARAKDEKNSEEEKDEPKTPEGPDEDKVRKIVELAKNAVSSETARPFLTAVYVELQKSLGGNVSKTARNSYRKILSASEGDGLEGAQVEKLIDSLPDFGSFLGADTELLVKGKMEQLATKKKEQAPSPVEPEPKRENPKVVDLFNTVLKDQFTREMFSKAIRPVQDYKKEIAQAMVNILAMEIGDENLVSEGFLDFLSRKNLKNKADFTGKVKDQSEQLIREIGRVFKKAGRFSDFIRSIDTLKKVVASNKFREIFGIIKREIKKKLSYSDSEDGSVEKEDESESSSFNLYSSEETPAKEEAEEENKSETPAKEEEENKSETPAKEEEENKSETPAKEEEENKSETPAKEEAENKSETPAKEEAEEENKSETPAKEEAEEENKSETPAKEEAEEENKSKTPAKEEEEEENKSKTPAKEEEEEKSENSDELSREVWADFEDSEEEEIEESLQEAIQNRLKPIIEKMLEGKNG